MNKEQALEKIKELENYIKELDSKPKRFKAEYSELYYFYMNTLHVCSLAEQNHLDSRERYILGNYYQSRQEAQANKEKYLKKLEILEWMEDNRKEFEYENINYFISWHYEYNEPSIYNLSFSQRSKYCFTEKKAQECIDKFGQDLKLIFE